jgi:hypothetical protein
MGLTAVLIAIFLISQYWTVKKHKLQR